MFVSFNGNTTGATSGSGSAYLFKVQVCRHPRILVGFAFLKLYFSV